MEKREAGSMFDYNQWKLVGRPVGWGCESCIKMAVRLYLESFMCSQDKNVLQLKPSTKQQEDYAGLSEFSAFQHRCSEPMALIEDLKTLARTWDHNCSRAGCLLAPVKDSTMLLGKYLQISLKSCGHELPPLLSLTSTCCIVWPIERCWVPAEAKPWSHALTVPSFQQLLTCCELEREGCHSLNGISEKDLQVLSLCSLASSQ